jgi:hypothetical protein
MIWAACDDSLDSLEEVVADDRNALDALPLEARKLPVKDGPPGDLDQTLGPGVRQRPEPLALAAGDDDGSSWRRHMR